MYVTGTIGGNSRGASEPIGSVGWISGKVGRRCNVKRDGTFPWQLNLTVAINYLACSQYEREETDDAQMRCSKKKEAFKNEKHTNLPEERRRFNRKSLVPDVTGCVSSSAGNPLVSDGHLVCVRVQVCGCEGGGQRHYITQVQLPHLVLFTFPWVFSASSLCLSSCQLRDTQRTKKRRLESFAVVKEDNHKQNALMCPVTQKWACVHHNLFVPI